MPYIIAIIVIFIVISLMTGIFDKSVKSGYFRSAKALGKMGELDVQTVLENLADTKKYVIHDLMVVVDGKSSQIDHVYINQNGVFVIETKNHSGFIFGNENQKQWTQTLNYGKEKHRLYNPILQNKSHIYALSKILKRSDIFTSVIIFPKAILNIDTSTYVGNLEDLDTFLCSPSSINKLAINEIDEIYNSLIKYKNHPLISEEDHINNIKRMKQNIKQNVCPRCGKTLVPKQGKYGSFYGCSGYPACTFKKSNKADKDY